MLRICITNFIGFILLTTLSQSVFSEQKQPLGELSFISYYNGHVNIHEINIECSGPYKNLKPNEKELRNIIEKHQLWLRKYGSYSYGFSFQANQSSYTLTHKLALKEAIMDSRRANLCGADLSGAKFIDVDLSGATLEGANLSGVKIDGSEFNATNFKSVQILNSEFSNTLFLEADFTKSIIRNTKFESLKFGGTNFSKSSMISVATSDIAYIDTDFSESYLLNNDFPNTEIFRAKFDSVEIIESNFSLSNIHKSSFKDSKRIMANFSNSVISETSFDESDLQLSEFVGAKIVRSSFKKAILNKVSFVDSTLISVNFHNSQLFYVDFNNSKLGGSDFSYSVFQPAGLPDKTSLSNIKGLDKVLIPKGEESGLVLIRKLIREAGLTILEREATYSIEHWKTNYSPFFTRWIKRIFVEYPTGYGLHVGRAAYIIAIIISLFSFVYYFIFISNSPSTKIVKHWPEKNNTKNISSATKKYMIMYSIYYSVTASFHFGWRDISLGTWISNMFPRDYVFKPIGWARTITGIQSLLSLYLLAVIMLTYFGKPFG